MKLKDLERVLKDNGYYIVRSSKHMIWSNGKVHVAVPRQKEINEMLSRRLLKQITA